MRTPPLTLRTLLHAPQLIAPIPPARRLCPRVQLASNVIAQLRIENDNLKATVARLTAQLAGGGEAPPAEGTVGEALPCEEHGEQGVLQGEAEGQPRGVEEQPVPAETAP